MAPTNNRTRDSDRDRSHRHVSHRAMLSRALHRANMAVNLDNAQDFEAARLSYADACDLLHQVVQRTTGDEEKRKLEAIRSTYTNRIIELDQIAPPQHNINGTQIVTESSNRSDKPELTNSGESLGDTDLAPHQIGATSKTEHRAWQERLDRTYINEKDIGQSIDSQSSLIGDGPANQFAPISHGNPENHSTRLTNGPESWNSNEQSLSPHAPPALSISGVAVKSNFSTIPPRSPSTTMQTSHGIDYSYPRTESVDFISWKGPNDDALESKGPLGCPPPFSMHTQHKPTPISCRDTADAGFCAATLDEVVEAAYGLGHEQIDSVSTQFEHEAAGSDNEVQTSLREARLAKELLQEAEEADINHRLPLHIDHPLAKNFDIEFEHNCRDFYDDDSSEDSEKASEHYNLREFGHQRQSPRYGKSTALPFSFSSAQPGGNQATTVKNTRTTYESDPRLSSTCSALDLGAANFTQTSDSTTVRSRRLSGQHTKQLKIETAAKFGTPNQIFFAENEGGATNPSTASSNAHLVNVLSTVSKDGVSLLSPRSVTPGFSTYPREAQASQSPDHTAANHPNPTSPNTMRPLLRTNYSSSSLRSSECRKMSLGNPDDSDMSPSTPSGNPFTSTVNNKLSNIPSSVVPLIPTFSHNGAYDAGMYSGVSRFPNCPAGGVLHLLDDNLHAFDTPGSPNALTMGGPAPLEACSTDFTFRPFWLMRCIYQTLVHPCGGYVSTRLFVPRDAWKVKGVKLKNVEDKIAGCDLLTAALLKLSRVDHNDADAVLEEMQSFEAVMDHVQANLSRRLGNEVGPHASGLMNTVAIDGELTTAMPRSSSVSSKSSSFSWKRLRSKNSAAGLGPGSGPKIMGPDAVVEMLAPASIPMTSSLNGHAPKRDFHQVQFSGPNASYMTSLAQLFDAVQAIDQIARQVDDPGLKHADKTQVGLELSTRRAAEFFGFYICRFVLSDMTLLLDKFIKRGSEWVLS